MVFKSACIPAPPPESDPAIVYTTINFRMVDLNTAFVDDVRCRRKSLDVLISSLGKVTVSVIPFNAAVSVIGIENEWHLFGRFVSASIVTTITIIIDCRDRQWI